MSRRRRAPAVAIAVAALALATGAQKSSSTRYGFPKLSPGQLWVSSVPVGLEVYLGEKQTGKPAGRTPLLVRTTNGVSHVTVVLQKTEFKGDLPDQLDLADHTAYRTHSRAHIEGETRTEKSRGITYVVDPAKKQTLIASFQPKSASLTEWARRYPSGSNFRFAADRVRRDLQALEVPQVFVDTGIDLLRKGGKVSLPSAKGWIVAEVTVSGQVAISKPPA